MVKTFLLIPLVVLVAGTAYAQGGGRTPGGSSHPPIVRYPLEFAVTPPVRDLPPGRTKESGEKERPLHRPFMRSGNGADPVVQTSTPTFASAQGVNQWEGLGAGYPGFTITAVPPDPNIAVGPNHIVQWVNNAFVVFDKQGNQIQGPVDDGSFWGLMSTCTQLGGFSDPIVQYDRMADRWIIGEVALPLLPPILGQFAQCFAVSTTSDPTGSYYTWAYGFGTDIPDYPKISVWPDGYYVTFNIFHSSGAFVGPEACAWDRNGMLQGVHAPAFVCFNLNGAFYASLLPSDLDGATLPPPGSPNFFMNIDPSSSALNMWSFHANFANPQNSTFVGPVSIAGVAPFTSPCIPDIPECIPQPGTTMKLDALGDRLMYRLAYRNFGDHASIVANHTVLTPGGNTAVRWYEVRNPGPTPTIFQQGTFAPDNDNRWMGSIAMDKSGNIGVGYSVASGLTYPSIRVTGWEVGDTPGELQTETFAVVGSGSQTGYDRWGDYSAMRIDPSNDCTFWYTQEYQATTQSAGWNTRIIAFQFPSCGQSLTPTTTTISSSANPSTSGQMVTFTVTVSPAAATGTVQFFDGASSLGTIPLSSGTASLSTAALAVGSHAITAAYSGNSSYAGSTSSVLTQTVNTSLISTTTALTSSLNPSTFGQMVTFTATVSPAAATGTVQFFDGANSLGTIPLSSGTASFSTAAPAVGSHAITAAYSGDSSYAASTSSVLTQTVNASSISTTTALASSPNPSTYGQSVGFTAFVSSSSGTPTGTVIFRDGATTLGSSALDAGGFATLSVSSLSAGTHTVTAQYNGDSTFSGSTSPALSQTVNKANATTTLTSNRNPSNNQQPVTFTATVSPSTATGIVQFFDGATLLGSAPLSGGVASLTTTSLSGGSHPVTANYVGDGNYNGSTSAVLTQTVRGKK
jgi:Bacterial Ig-like domain (group 3)